MTNGDKITKFITDVTDCCSDGWKCSDCPLNGAGGSCSEEEYVSYLGKEADNG